MVGQCLWKSRASFVWGRHDHKRVVSARDPQTNGLALFFRLQFAEVRRTCDVPTALEKGKSPARCRENGCALLTVQRVELASGTTRTGVNE